MIDGGLPVVSPRKRIRILGIPVHVTTMLDTVDTVLRWAAGSQPRSVFVREVASLMAAREEPNLSALHETADLVVPDGMPLVWIGRLRGHGETISKVSGADLVDEVCAASVACGNSHYFFGGKPGVASSMARRLTQRHPGLKVVGTFSPPMREITAAYHPDSEALSEMEAIKVLNPDFVWVGISSPKQEYWIAQATSIVGRGVFFGVGAAFDFHAGTVKRAPKWMQSNGLEWLYRLASEPRRLWRRYLVSAPLFVWLSIGDEFQIRRHRNNAKNSR